jgi:pimeloyl-ACP methyl ester carboxylesterase
MKKFFSELKRRRVIRMSIAYIIVGWALIEAGATLFPMFEAPAWMPRAFTIIVFLGFPIAIILAWAIQITPEGIVVEGHDKAVVPEQGKIQFVSSGDGTRIAYALSGAGPPIVKTAHWLTNLELDWQSPVWRHWLTNLSDGYQLLRYDGRGCGLSDRSPQNIDFEAMVSDLECVVDAAGFEQFALFGSSQGGPVSITYAVRHPERVSALILYGSYAQGWAVRCTGDALDTARAMVDLVRLGWGQDNPAFRQMFGSLFLPEANQEQRDAFDLMTRESATPDIAARILTTLGDIDVKDILPELKLPVLVLHGRGDARFPHELGHELASCIPGAEFRTLEGCNHIILENEPAFGQFRSAVREFLERHPSKD